MALTKIDDRGLKTPIDLLDNEKIRFGTGNDLEIYHDGTKSYIQNSTGNLEIQSDTFWLEDKTNGHGMIHGVADGAVSLYYNNLKQIETTNDGITVTNSNTNVTGAQVLLKNYNNTVGYLYGSGTSTPDFGLLDSQGHWGVKVIKDGAVELYHDNSKKVETTSSGATVTGNLNLGDNGSVKWGDGNDLNIYHDGTDTKIVSVTGSTNLYCHNFVIRNDAGNESIVEFDANGACKLYYNNSKKIETNTNGIHVTGTVANNYDGSSAYGLNPNDSETSGTHIQFQRQGYNNGNITHDTNNCAYNTSGSDRTLKKNFEDWTDSYWTAFKNINPQKFHFLTDEDTDPKCKGYIAQDLVDSFPEAYPKEVVSQKYMFNPSGMVPYLMKTLKEALIEIDTLKTKVAALEAA